jgi:hypothetical protein
MSLKPWKSDVTKGVIVTSIFLSGILFGMNAIVFPAAAVKLGELGFPQNPILLVLIMMFHPALYLSIAIHFLNKEFVWRG